ncbi:cellulose biosynthesis protein BcsN [Pararhizobium sp. BT-229]|uniref:cellulose biosynthesis protein BcsN n=1 Tax=Pararhizobium sp. BT-229 TaxID=2986923 RepID=UPI0021F6E5AF|nr:cellulose biosynthesis protein BcsN [Pararhizobium sp. BT-229]MCV9967196.1 cellulose biosynthesis protein BcsN [Pararhizobium sp. BT-229]
MSFPRFSLSTAALGIVLALGLAGCGARDGVRLTDTAVTVPDETAFALPPPGGPAVVSIVERRFANSTQQDIFLFTSATTPGQNVLRVQLFGPVGSQMDGQKSLGYSSIRASEIAKEMRSELPGVALRQSPLYLQNNYGPFSYAYGRGRGNDACIYGWQQIRSPEATRTAFQNRGTIQVRLRLCEEGASEEKLLSVMYGYTIRSAFNAAGWNPYGEPPSVDPTLGRTGNPIYPKTEDLREEPVASVKNARPRPISRQRQVVRPVENKEPVKQPASEETIPLPTGMDIDAVVVPSPCMTQSEGGTQCK